MGIMVMEIRSDMKLTIALLTLHLSAAGLAAILYHTDNRILPSRLDYSEGTTAALALEQGNFEKTAVAPTHSTTEAPSAQVDAASNLTVAPDYAYADLAEAWIPSAH